MTTNLTDYKNKKKYKKIVEDLEAIIKVISLSQQALSHYKVYKVAQELISVHETNKTLLDLQLKKYQKELQRINDT